MSKRVTIDELADWLRSKDDFVLLGHVNPDGDAVGSTMALWHVLRSMGKRAVVCLPGGRQELYSFLPGSAQVLDVKDPLPFEPRTAFAVDVSDPERFGEKGKALFEACPNRAVLDHHKTNPGFGQIYVLNGDAAAAGEMAVDLIPALGAEWSKDAADCLFVAISTDCGQFSYSNCRPQTFEAAARCVAAGADVNRLTRLLYRTRTGARTRLLGEVLSCLEVSQDGSVAWARLTNDMLRRTGAEMADSEGIINYLQEIQGVKVAVLATERGSNTKISLRSETSINVARDVAVPLGGGGHDCAAGVTLQMSIEDALRKVLDTVRQTIERM